MTTTRTRATTTMEKRRRQTTQRSMPLETPTNSASDRSRRLTPAKKGSADGGFSPRQLNKTAEGPEVHRCRVEVRCRSVTPGDSSRPPGTARRGLLECEVTLDR